MRNLTQQCNDASYCTNNSSHGANYSKNERAARVSRNTHNFGICARIGLLGKPSVYQHCGALTVVIAGTLRTELIYPVRIDVSLNIFNASHDRPPVPTREMIA